MVSIDLRDAYLQIPIHPDIRKYLSLVALDHVFSIQSSLFQSLYGSAVFHMGHGSGLSHSASPEYSHVQIPGRLVKPASSSFSGSPSSGDGRPSLSGSRCRHHLGEVQSPSIAASGLSGGLLGSHSLQGFSLPAESGEAMLNRRSFSVLLHSTCLFVAKDSRSPIILDSSLSGRQAVDPFPSAPSSSPVGSERRLHLNSVTVFLRSLSKKVLFFYRWLRPNGSVNCRHSIV